LAHFPRCAHAQLAVARFQRGLCHARQISFACFLSRIFVERKTRLLVLVSGLKIEMRRTGKVCPVDDGYSAFGVFLREGRDFSG
jgi:hypothetical protein